MWCCSKVIVNLRDHSWLPSLSMSLWQLKVITSYGFKNGDSLGMVMLWFWKLLPLFSKRKRKNVIQNASSLFDNRASIESILEEWMFLYLRENIKKCVVNVLEKGFFCVVTIVHCLIIRTVRILLFFLNQSSIGCAHSVFQILSFVQSLFYYHNSKWKRID